MMILRRLAICLALALSLSSCAWVMPWLQQPTPLAPATATAIGPYPAFSGRLIVMEPSRRWQVAIDWQSHEPTTGTLRLSHAVTGTVVDFRWTDAYMQIRDNEFPHWRHIQQQELTEHGLVLPPVQLANILLGYMPKYFHQTKPGTWESTDSGSLIRLRWQPKVHTLTISDIGHERTAKLIIKNTN